MILNRRSMFSVSLFQTLMVQFGLIGCLWCSWCITRADDSAADSVSELTQEVAKLAESDVGSSRRLIAIDNQLQQLGANSAAKRLQLSVLTHLAIQRTPAGMEYIRSVFETQTPRRHDAAYALSIAALKRPSNDQDWRYLVRSLTIVNGEQAVSVLRALRRFRRRATKAVWIREVILKALELPENDQPVALDLLNYWMNQRPAKNQSSGEQLAAIQKWFAKTYSNQPPAMLPVDLTDAKWTYEKLGSELSNLPSDAKSGGSVFVKATCNKCHRRTGAGKQPNDDRLGPNLNSLGWRRQPKEILTAILFPSHRLNDEYPVTTVILSNGKSVSGLLMPDATDRMKVVAADGKETVFARKDLEETVPSRVSNMPGGLLEPLTLEEIRQLLAFLSSQSGDYDPHRRSAP